MLDTIPPVDKTDPTPRHVQAQRILHELVMAGHLRPGDKIPAETQIARVLGISKMTVNKAILALTAQGVFERHVGRGTFVAQAARRKKSPLAGSRPRTARARPARIVLNFVPDVIQVEENYYYGSLARTMREAIGAAAPEMDVVLAAPEHNSTSAIAAVNQNSAGCLFVAPRAEQVPWINDLGRSGKPVVIVGASWPNARVPVVDSDNQGGAIAAMHYLLRLGHRRIGFLSAEEDTANVQDRMAGYRCALAEAGIRRESWWEISVSNSWADAAALRTALRRWCEHERPITALLAAGHYLALGALQSMGEMRKSVPGDLSLIGFDDPLSAQLSSPALTAVRQPLPAMGKLAVEHLLRQLRGDVAAPAEVVMRALLPTELVVRQSTAPLQPH